VVPVLTVLNEALAGHPIDVNDAGWSDLMCTHQSTLPLVGSINNAWQRGRKLFPDQPQLWRDALQHG